MQAARRNVPPSRISTANPCEPTIATDPKVRGSTDSFTASAMSLPEPKLRAADRQRPGDQMVARQPARKHRSHTVSPPGRAHGCTGTSTERYTTADGRMPRRYSRRDTPTWLYRLPGLHDRMPCMGLSAKAQSHTAPSTEGILRQVSPRRRSESRQRTALVAVRLLPHERDMLSETARARGVSLSEFIRSSAMSIASGLGAGSERP